MRLNTFFYSGCAPCRSHSQMTKHKIKVTAGSNIPTSAGFMTDLQKKTTVQFQWVCTWYKPQSAFSLSPSGKTNSCGQRSSAARLLISSRVLWREFESVRWTTTGSTQRGKAATNRMETSLSDQVCVYLLYCHWSAKVKAGCHRQKFNIRLFCFCNLVCFSSEWIAWRTSTVEVHVPPLQKARQLMIRRGSRPAFEYVCHITVQEKKRIPKHWDTSTSACCDGGSRRWVWKRCNW